LRYLVPSCVASVLAEITHIAATISQVSLKIAPVTAQVTCISLDLLSVGAKLGRRCISPPILAQLAKVRAAFDFVLSNVTSIAAYVSRVRSNLMAICAQIPPLKFINPLCGCGRPHGGQ
jgi:hypothetical protein